MAPLSQACKKPATAVSLLLCLVHKRGPCRFQLLQVKVTSLQYPLHLSLKCTSG